MVQKRKIPNKKRIGVNQKMKKELARRRTAFFLDHVASEHAVKKYVNGKKFLNGFKFSLYKTKHRTFLVDLKTNLTQNPISIALMCNKPRSKNKTEIIYEARIRFSGKNIVIESIQGSPHLVEIRDFEKSAGLPASRFLFREIVRQAQDKGYKNILIKRPEKQESFENPYFVRELDKRGKELYEKKQFGEATPLELAEFNRNKTESINIIRARMKKLYETVAIAERMSRKGDYFIKRI